VNLARESEREKERARVRERAREREIEWGGVRAAVSLSLLSL
jgi:hypothetical protein